MTTHTQQPHGPSHTFQDFDPPHEVRAWYGQDSYCLPEGEGVKIHCLLPLNKLDVPFRQYPTVPWIELQDERYRPAFASYNYVDFSPVVSQ